MKPLLRFPYIGVWVLLAALAGLSSNGRASSDVNLVAEEIQKAVPAAIALEAGEEREGTLMLLALGLARVGRFEAALEVIRHHGNDKLKQVNQDEIWRVTARRLAWQRDIAAAMRCANRIEGEFSRADALLAVARATRRTGDTDAAQEILKRASPTVRATQSPLALAHLAYLFVQNGDAAAARRLFDQALAAPYPNADESFIAQRAIVAHFQAKCAWSREAIATAGTELGNLQQAKPLLIARREWTLLREFADRLSPRQAIDLLLELSATQLAKGEGDEARRSLAAARARFTSLPPAKEEASAIFALHLRLALLEIAHGETEAGWKRFETLTRSQQFNSKWEFAFYYSLIAPQNRAVLQLSPPLQAEYEQKATAAWLRQTTVVDSILPFSLLDVARAQMERGDGAAAHQTLTLEKSRIRNRLVPDKKEADATIPHHSLAAYDLIALADCEREAGLKYQVTLAQARQYWRARNNELGGLERYVEVLLRQGFFDEADRVLSEIGYPKITPEMGLLPGRAKEYAAAQGVLAAVQWSRKFPDVTSRSMALFSIAAWLGRIPDTGELSLRGSDLDNLKVDGWPRSAYRPLLDLAPFTVHE